MIKERRSTHLARHRREVKYALAWLDVVVFLNGGVVERHLNRAHAEREGDTLSGDGGMSLRVLHTVYSCHFPVRVVKCPELTLGFMRDRQTGVETMTVS